MTFRAQPPTVPTPRIVRLYDLAELASGLRVRFEQVQLSALAKWARPLRGWPGRSFAIDIGPHPPPYAEPDTLISFDAYSADELCSISSALGVLGAAKRQDAQFVEALNRAGSRYRNLRNDCERYLARDERRSELFELRNKLRALQKVEKDRGAACPDYLWELSKRETQVDIQLLKVDPFVSPDSYVSSLFEEAADPRKRQFPEAELICDLLKIFASATDQPIAMIEIGRVRTAGKFMAFAWECTHRFRNRIGENTIVSLANKAKRAL